MWGCSNKQNSLKREQKYTFSQFKVKVSVLPLKTLWKNLWQLLLVVASHPGLIDKSSSPYLCIHMVCSPLSALLLCIPVSLSFL